MMMIRSILFLLFLISFSISAHSKTRIVTWNAKAELTESLEDRLEDFSRFAQTMKPDVIILTEMNGQESVQKFISQLGWNKYYAITSNFSKLSSNVYFALEMAIVSKIPINKVIEYDASPDGTHKMFSHDGISDVETKEIKLTSNGIKHFGDPLRSTDRGTLRVDLENGLSIFPVHLKSNRISICSEPKKALKIIKDNGFDLSAKLIKQLDSAADVGFPGVTKVRLSNAKKRERIIAAVAREAEKAISEDRIAVIAGDFNTAFEEGKVGYKPQDCSLQDFSCAKAPFPKTACENGDGYDDTLGILVSGLVGPTKWSLTTRNLGRTYDDPVFSDKAIDHFAVPVSQAHRFTKATKPEDTFGSDHYPVLVTYSE